MSLNSLNCVTDLTCEKQKIVGWVMNWLNDNTESKQNAASDIPQIIVLLQCLGFVLQKFETENHASNDTDFPNCKINSVLKLEVTCSKSGMKAEMSKSIGNCKCPSKEDTDDAQFWSINGLGPANQNRVDASLSSLLPKISLTKTKIVTDILNELVCIINDTNNNQNEEIPPPPSLERHRSLDTLKRNSNLEFPNKPLIRRQPTWEVDPKTSPPAETSSPVPDLCKTMDDITINSNNKSKLEENLRQIITIAENCLESVSGKNSTFSKTVIKRRVSDIKRRSIDDGLSIPTTRTTNISKHKSPNILVKSQITRLPIKSSEKQRFAGVTSKIDTRRACLSPTWVKTGAIPKKSLSQLNLKHKASDVKEEAPKSIAEVKTNRVKKTGTGGSKLQNPKILGNAAAGSAKL